VCGGVDEDVSSVEKLIRERSMPLITDWLMVAITAVYVVATIFICRANIKSAEATREQVAEARRQYEEEHRPYVSYQFIYERHTWYGMRFTNHGKRVANHVQIKLDKEFLDSLEMSQFFEGLRKLQDREFTLGIGQSYDILFGAADFRRRPDKKPIAGEILYQDSREAYRETFEIDFEKYATLFSVEGLEDVLHGDMKKQTAELKKIAHTLEQIESNLSAVENFHE
jgi:hypothetical protein